MGDRERPRKQHPRDAEDSGIGANAESKGENGDCREAGAAAKRTQSVAEVVRHSGLLDGAITPGVGMDPEFLGQRLPTASRNGRTYRKAGIKPCRM
jgi:hypothetical protein